MPKAASRSPVKRKTVRKAARKAGAPPQSKPPSPRAGWKRVLEYFLIQEGYSRAEAKELVALSAE